MNIVLTTHFSPWSRYHGGGQHSTHNLASALARRGHQVTVVYTRPAWERPPVPEDLEYRIRWALLPALRSRRAATFRFLAPAFVARAVRHLASPGDVVHGSGDEAALLSRLRTRVRFRFVMTPRFPSYPDDLRPLGSGLADRTRLWLVHTKYLQLGQALRGADVVCPTSRSAANQVRRAYGTPENRIRIIPNGIQDAFRSAQWNGDSDSGPIVFFGRLAHAKGADVLLRALALLADPPETLLIGRGEEAPALQRLVDELGFSDRVVLRDWMSPGDLAVRLAGASMAVLPSREESFGNAIAEAMAVGVPVVSTNVGSVPELLEDGRSGLMVPPDDPQALAVAIRTLRGDRELSARLGRAARQRVLDRFTWERVAEMYEPVYARRPGSSSEPGLAPSPDAVRPSP